LTYERSPRTHGPRPGHSVRPHHYLGGRVDGFTRSCPFPLGRPPSSEMQAGIRRAQGSWLTHVGSPNPCLTSQGLLFADGAICLGRTSPKCLFGSPTNSRLQLFVRAGDSRQRRTVGSARGASNGERRRLKISEGADDCGGRGEYRASLWPLTMSLRPLKLLGVSYTWCTFPLTLGRNGVDLISGAGEGVKVQRLIVGRSRDHQGQRHFVR
jgi:hypothetical protein